MTDLLSRLGRDSTARLLVVSCRNLGQAHSANVAVYECLRSGLATTASLMVPCPWSRDAAERHLGEDVGVQITLNCELDRYRWGPVTMSPSLVDGDGGFPRTLRDLWDHADLDELRLECRSQVERAILWGFDITHLAVHLDALQQRPEFFDIYLDLACEYGLPIELPEPADEGRAGFPARALATAEGVVFADHVIDVGNRPSQAAFEHALLNLEPGVTLVRFQPALDEPEIRGLDPSWSRRVEDYLVTVHDHRVRSLIERSGVELVGYQELRDLMRG